MASHEKKDGAHYESRTTLSTEGEAALTGGHPWVYEGEVTSVTGSPADGDLVDVVSRRGSWLGAGFYNSRSLIRVRLLSRNPNDRFDPDFWARRVKYAWDYRKTVMAPEELAGLSATVTGEKLLIQYDGPALAAGVGDTVSPANCIPYLLRALAEGYVLEVGEETLEDTPCLRLALDTTDADGEKVVCTVWLAEEEPGYAELSREGKLLLSVRFTAFQQTKSDGGE